MRHTILILLGMTLFIISCASSKGTNLKNYYNRYSQQSGDLFFLYEYDDFYGQNNKSNFHFDVTLQQEKEMVTINYTFFSEDTLSTKAFNFETDDFKLSAPTERLFIDSSNNKWQYRYSTKIGYYDFKNIIDSPEPPVIGVVLEDETVFTYTTKDRPWQKYKNAVVKILYLFEIN
jgi:hypothetical protein